MASASVHESLPLSEMNTTPLIDVLLVLLVMFIITIPLQSHAVKLDLPANGVPVDAVRNKIVVTEAGQLLWNETPVSLAQLSTQLGVVGDMVEQPEVQLQPEPLARYALVAEVLAMTKRAKVTRLGFVGNERYASF